MKSIYSLSSHTDRYEVTPSFELLAGGRYVDLDIDAKLTLPGLQQKQLKVSGQESWVDPIIGAEYRGRFPNTNKWRYILHATDGAWLRAIRITAANPVGRQSFADVYQVPSVLAAATSCRPTLFDPPFSIDPGPAEG